MRLRISALFLILIALTSIILPLANAAWQTVQTFSGTIPRITNAFNIPGDKWRITYSIELDPDYPDNGFLGVIVFPEGDEQNEIGRFETDASRLSGSYSVYRRGSGRYYLEIYPSNVKYTLRVEYESSSASSTGVIGDSWVAIVVVLAIFVLVVAVFVVHRKLGKSKSERTAARQNPPTSVVQIKEQTPASETSFYCRYCGAENKTDAVFCRKCGKDMS